MWLGAFGVVHAVWAILYGSKNTVGHLLIVLVPETLRNIPSKHIKRSRPSSPSSVSRIKQYIRARVPSGIIEEKALGFLLKYLSRKYSPRHIIKAFDRAFEEGTLKNLLQHVAAVQREEDFKSKRRGRAH
jgi:hypothetical protein